MESNIIKILAIDDNQDNLISLKAMLKDLFPYAKVFTSVNGTKGIEIASNENPDVILLDIVMPEKNGFEICKTLKANKILCDIPVVFVTAIKRNKENRIRALECGAEAFLAKPIDESELFAQIRAMVLIKESRNAKLNENERLAELVEKKTRELREIHLATLNLLEDLKTENEKRRQSELALKESEQKFRNLFSNHAAVKLIIDPDNGNIVEANQAAAYFYGWTIEELKAMNIQEINVLSSDEVIREMENAKCQKKNQIEFKHQKADKTIIDVEVYSSNIEINDKVFLHSIIHDITKRKHAETALRESEKKYRLLFESNPQPMWVYDIETLNFLEVNKVAILKYGYSRSEFLKLNLKDIRPIEDIEVLIDNVKQQNNDYSYSGEWRHKNKNGDVFLVEIISQSINYKARKARLVLANDISMRKIAEEKLMITQFGIDNAQIGVYQVEEDGTIVYANHYAAATLGYSLKELIGKSLFEIAPLYNGTNFMEHRKKTKEKGSTTLISVHKRKDGSMFPVEVTVNYFQFKDRLLSFSFVKDITKRKQAEEKINLFKRAVDSSSMEIVITDIEGSIIYANPYFLEMTGYTYDEITEKKSHLLKMGNLDVGFSQELWTTILSGKDWTGEMQTKKKNGELYWVKTVISPIIDGEGQVSHFVVIKENITQRKQIMEDLIIAKQKAEENDQLKTAFLSNMSHEIRTPMNAVLGFSQLITAKNISKMQKNLFAEYINTNGESLLKIIDDIIDISKIQSKQLTIKKNDFDLHKLFQELEMFYSNLLLKKANKKLKLQLQLFYPKEAPFIIHSDEIRLKQILNNLISNAIKYTEKGKITIGYEIKDKRIQIFVKDTGIGISSKEQQHIFERFVQYSKKYISRQEGTGLGLAISKELVFLLGGELLVKSTEGKGATFYFNLPNLSVENKPVESKVNGNDLINIDLSGYTILIADDEESNYILTKRMLHETKVKTEWAKNGKKAVELAVQKKIDLILMDIKMPDMDGIEATRLIKMNNNKLPIIMQTAFAMPQIKDESIEAGCNDFIVKPFTTNNLLELIIKQLVNKPY